MNILFLDIDGPMIPARMYYDGIPKIITGKKADVWMFDPLAVAMVNHLIDTFKIKLVFNTSHNALGIDHILNFQYNGITRSDYHDDFMTKYPLGLTKRMDAISEWLTRHPEVTKWVVLDDWPIESDRAVLVDYNYGITLDNFEQLVKLFK